MSLTYKDVAEILRIVDESDVEELIIELADSKLVVRRNAATGAATASRPATAPVAQPAPEPPAPAPLAVPEPAPAPAEAPPPAALPAGFEVKAPMVGTFYRKPGPQDPPFVEIGDHVNAGDPLCLIEVMKLFTTIEAPVSGKIAAISAENEALVQLDEVLLVIEPD